MRPFVVLASVALIVVAIVTTLLLSGQGSSSHSGAKPSAVVSAVVTLTAQASPAASPTPSPWGIQETTLVDAISGRVLKLQQGSEVVWNVEFSGDGRWLVYSRSADLNEPRMYRLNLESSGLVPEDLGSGGLPHISSDGSHIAYGVPDTSGLPSITSGPWLLSLLKPDGSREILPNRGSLAEWSPDGRWLAYLSAYEGEGVPRGMMVYDSATAVTRKLDEMTVGGGDYRIRPEWSRSSRYFSYRNDVSVAGGRRVYDPTNARKPLDVPFDGVWAPQEDSLFGYNASAQTPDYGFLEVDRGTWRPLRGPQPFPMQSNELVLSPDGTKLARAFLAPGLVAQTAIYAVDGTLLIPDIDGGFDSWSSDSSILLTRSPACREGFALHRAADGGLMRCLEQVSATKFSPSGSLLAHVKPTPYPSEPRLAMNTTNDVYVLDLATGQERRVISNVRGPLRCLKWSSDARWLVLTGFCDGI